MPRGDQTGPMGLGPRTGRAAGFCAGYDMPGYMNPVGGRRGGFGAGRGAGRGMVWRSYVELDWHAVDPEGAVCGIDGLQTSPQFRPTRVAETLDLFTQESAVSPYPFNLQGLAQ